MISSMLQHTPTFNLSVLGSRAFWIWMALLATLALSACGGGGPQSVEVAVQVGNEKMNPETVQVKQGDTVTLKINAAEAGEFHLHGYDLEQDLEEAEVADMVFVAEATGRFRITFHHEEEADEHKPGSEGAGEAKHDEEEEKDIGFLEVLPR